MNLFIFGAGASYGSDSNKSILPPLAKDLFDCLTQRYLDISGHPHVMSLASIFRNDFEQGVLELYKVQPHFLSVLQRCMAHFFFQYGHTIPIQQNNLYYKLAQHMKKCEGQLALATLNYERILEISFGAAGVSMVCNTLPSLNQVELCFPHGCCHLFCDGVRATARGVSFSGIGVSTNGSISHISSPIDFENRIRNDAFPPVMSYFEPKKVTTSGANFVVAQRNRLAELISSASKIAIIGIKVREHDSHIWGPLRKTNATIIYCGGTDAINEYNQWSNNVPEREKDKVLTGYWDQEFDRINNEML